MDKREIKEVAKEVFALLKEHGKKVKKYSKGKIFTWKCTIAKPCRNVNLGTKNYPNVIKNSMLQFFVAPDRLGDTYIVPTYGHGLAFDIEEFRKYAKLVEEVLDYAEKMEANTEMKDVLDP